MTQQYRVALLSNTNYTYNLEEYITLKKTLYFCDKCGKQTKSVMNGDIQNNLYSFLFNNCNNFPNMDKYGIGFEICGECAEELASILEVFYSFDTEDGDIYKKEDEQVITALGTN